MVCFFSGIPFQVKSLSREDLYHKIYKGGQTLGFIKKLRTINILVAMGDQQSSMDAHPIYQVSLPLNFVNNFVNI